ncbi:MAG: phosphotransferase family protein [Methyloligellaceae bacterium]
MAHATRPRTLDPADLVPFEAWLAATLAAEQAKVRRVELLAGGAIGENWRILVQITGGDRAGLQDWVLRTDAPSRLVLSHNRAEEFACLKAAHAAGVTVPEPIADCAEASIIGAPFMLVGFADGIAQARKIVRDPNIGDFGSRLAQRLGAEIARLHAIRPGQHGLDFLAPPETSPAHQQIADLRSLLDTTPEPRPALEYVLSWLERNAPADQRIVLCHGDFRTGNYLVDRGLLTGILDWEFAHWGDPHFDIGWFCARCWRFGADDRAAGGIAEREAFYRGYNETMSYPLEPAIVPYWEIMAAARWAVIALLQGARASSGHEPSVELLLTGLMAPEMEYDALAGIAAVEQAERLAAHG